MFRLQSLGRCHRTVRFKVEPAGSVTDFRLQLNTGILTVTLKNLLYGIPCHSFHVIKSASKKNLTWISVKSISLCDSRWGKIVEKSCYLSNVTASSSNQEFVVFWFCSHFFYITGVLLKQKISKSTLHSRSRNCEIRFHFA